ncbi:acyl carrier protein [Companilactobacillus alimentarius]|uniref:acyl carrier protein n=1 Tax=Companilactobacillus alimentarius TaxID=1602 RepID=UPI0028B93015|nr:acyl carrier protein [Companilactobacillus alimentarius]MDT6951270.1 acyl carrier protein [Companilactobacillus alimentarius]
MTKQEVFDKINSLIADKFEVEPSTITRETSFTKDLDADSIDLVEFVLELEDAFGSEIPDDDAEKITTVGEAVDYISSHQK